MSDHQDDTTPLEYLITGLVILSFGLLYFFINHGFGFWSNPVDKVMLASAPTEVVPPRKLFGAGTVRVPGSIEKQPDHVRQGDDVVVKGLDPNQAEIKQLNSEVAAQKQMGLQADMRQLAAEKSISKQAEETALKQAAAEKLKADEMSRKLADKQAELERVKEELRKKTEQARLANAANVRLGFEASVKNAMLNGKVNESHIFDGIYFESGSSKLKVASQDQIKAIADLMGAHKDSKILIRGHTDNTGTVSDNSLLSLTRSDSMRKALVGLGVTRERIKIEGVGQLEPIASNDTLEGQRKNRRIELILIE